jgi:RNA polymerase sigma-70 factor (ECF subfamily)
LADAKRLAPEEIAALYSLYGEELRQFLRALLRDDSLAADALQTTYARLLERGHESSEERRRSWLFQVAYREAMLLRRKAKTRQNAQDRLVREANATPVDDRPERRLDRQEQLARLRRAIDGLPETQRQVLELKIYEERTFREIAERLGIPLGTALARLRAATLRLRRELDDGE